MALYIMLSNLTDEGRKTIKARPNASKKSTKRSSPWVAKCSPSTLPSAPTTS